MLLTLFIVAIVVLGLGYVYYGRFQKKLYDLDPNAETPATKLNDGMDYCPAHPAVLLGHHFASIAGAGSY